MTCFRPTLTIESTPGCDAPAPDAAGLADYAATASQRRRVTTHCARLSVAVCLAGALVAGAAQMTGERLQVQGARRPGRDGTASIAGRALGLQQASLSH